jgi:hypothetical protein
MKNKSGRWKRRKKGRKWVKKHRRGKRGICVTNQSTTSYSNKHFKLKDSCISFQNPEICVMKNKIKAYLRNLHKLVMVVMSIEEWFLAKYLQPPDVSNR